MVELEVESYIFNNNGIFHCAKSLTVSDPKLVMILPKFYELTLDKLASSLNVLKVLCERSMSNFKFLL